MGQQQLLLIILAMIIVGVAAVLAITLFQDNAVDHDRKMIIADLTILSQKATHYRSRPTTLGGGGNSFVGLTADASGLATLASPSFTNNPNGIYSIKTAGTSTQVVLRGVGKVAMDGGSFPTYDMTVTSQTRIISKIN
ncbi:MAG TPA: hypothetical protein VMM58_00515 [Bacteroidota bacterium]|nr:hypothetical protein [Bacteroidota bacterium]